MTSLLFALVIATAPPSQCGVTSAEKEAFLEMLTQLPTKGEFFTDDAVTKAVPQTRVLLALTEKDIKGRAFIRSWLSAAGSRSARNRANTA